MSQTAGGLGLALAAMLLFGLYMVPRKLSGLRDYQFVLSMSMGILAVCGPGVLLLGTGRLTRSGLLSAAACGPLWSLGMICYTLAVTEMGLALATPIKNTTAVWGVAIGILAFGEGRETAPLPCAIGSLLVVSSAAAFGRAGGKGGTLTRRGAGYALAASLGFAAYTAPLKRAMDAGMGAEALVGIVGLGVLCCAGVLVWHADGTLRRWWARTRQDHALGALAGALWASATLTMAAAIHRVGLAITWPVTNLNTLVTVAAGIWAFHEVDPRRQAKPLALGAALGIMGVMLLGYSHMAPAQRPPGWRRPSVTLRSFTGPRHSH